ncbi:glucose dehydrogenase [Acidobacteria bacterium Mor1]|nr:glucose dehydrogenase [Acidobacteria bacterium Mor1]
MTQKTEKKGLTAIVTGSSTGIGFGVARRLLESGINVVLAARTEKDLADAATRLSPYGNVAYLAGDVAEPGFGDRLVRKAVEEFGGVDILVNNAGVFHPKPFLETEEADLDRFFAINFKGSYFTAQAAVPEMKKRGGGAIVNVGTTLVEHAIAGFPASGAIASKAALHSLTHQLAAELGEDNIRVSTIATGIIETPLQRKMGIADVQSLAGLHLLNRVGSTEDMADAVAMLAQNDFITGTTLRVDGGHAAGHVFG